MGCCNVVAILIMADTVCLDRMQKLHVQYLSNAGSLWYVGVLSYAMKFIAAEHGKRLKELLHTLFKIN